MYHLWRKVGCKMKYSWCCQCGFVGNGIKEYVKHIEEHNLAEKELEKKKRIVEEYVKKIE